MLRFGKALLLLASMASATGAAGPAQRDLTVEDLWKVQRLGPPAISPDGAWCCIEVTTWNLDKDEGQSELWLLKSDGSQRQQLTNTGTKNSGPRWSPDGQWIAFTSKRGNDELQQLYVISPNGGEARKIAKTSFAPSSLKWSGDAQSIFAIGWTWPDCTTGEEHRRREREQKDAKSKATIITEGTFRYWDKWLTDGKRPVVFSFDVATGKHRNLLAHAGRHLPPFEPSNADYDVSPDGKELCFVADNVAEFGLDSNLDLFALDLTQEKAKPRCLTEDNSYTDNNPVYHPDGSRIAFLRQTTKFFYADRSRIMVLDRVSGKAAELCPPGRPLDRSATNPRWLPNEANHSVPTMVASVEDQGYVRIGLFSANDPARLLPGGYSDRSLDVADKNATMAFLRSSFDVPSQLWVGDPRGSKRRIDNFNDDLTKQWRLGKVENVTFDGAGGNKVQMWIVYPPNFDPTKKWPLLQMVHGGPHNAITTDFSTRWNPQVWAAQGWVVGVVNFHGSSGFGQEFTDSITGDIGTKALDDIMKATEWFAAKPWIDANRMAAAGASYGGYMMAWMNGHTDKFKAMVCHAGVYNWHSMTASDLVRGRERSLGAPPWGDLTRIDRQNPQRLAANFKTPTLVIHGEKDYRVPVTQGFEYYNTLRQKGIPTRLVYFPDENHWILKAHNSMVWHREVFNWLERYIGRGPTGGSEQNSK